MSYWWYFLAAFVHVQAAFVLFVLFPLPTTRQWNWILHTKVIKYCSDTFGFDVWYFYVLAIVPCCVFCMDSIRDYTKYSSSELDDYTDQTNRKDRRILLLFSQRSYWISAAAVFLCIVVPRILSLRKESGLLCQQIDRLEPVGKGIKKLMKMVNEVQLEHDEDNSDNDHQNRNCVPGQQELLQLLLTELKQNRNRGDQRRGDERQEPWSSQDMKELIEYYEQLKNQREQQDRANNNHYPPENPNRMQQNHRLARSRFTSPSASDRRHIFVQVPQTPGGRFRII